MKKTFRKEQNGVVICTEIIDEVVVNERVVTSEQEKIIAESLKLQIEALQNAVIEVESDVAKIAELEGEKPVDNGGGGDN